MRRDTRDKNDKGKVKFRVIDFEIEGSDESLQESLRSIVSALGRPSSATGVSRSLPVDAAQGPSLRAKPTVPQGELFPEDAKVEEDAAIADSGDNQSTDAKVVRAANSKRRVVTPKILNNLDLDSGSVSLKEFCLRKKPTVDSKKYLVILSWLKEVRGLESVGVDHVYTCYRSMGWTAPKDVGSTLRALKKPGYVVSGDERGLFTITHVGQGVVDELSKEG